MKKSTTILKSVLNPDKANLNIRFVWWIADFFSCCKVKKSFCKNFKNGAALEYSFLFFKIAYPLILENCSMWAKSEIEVS